MRASKEPGPTKRTRKPQEKAGRIDSLPVLGVGLLAGEEPGHPESRHRLNQSMADLIINSTSDFMWCVDPDRFGLLAFNQSLSDYFLRERGIQIGIGMRPEDLFPQGRYVDLWHEIYEKALAQGMYSVDYPVYTGTRFLQLTVNLIRVKEKVIGISVFGKDETERKLIQDALRDNEEKFRMVFMTGLDVFYIATLDEGLIIETNDVFEEVFGYAREEAIGKTSLELGLYAHPEDRARVVDALERNGVVRDLEIAGRKKDGSLITVSLSIRVLVLGGKKHILGVIRDVSAIRKTEDALQKANEKYKEIFESAIEGMDRVSFDGHPLAVNNAMAKILGYDSKEELLGLTSDWGSQVWFDPTERTKFLALLQEYKTVQGYESRLRRKDGGIVWASHNSRLTLGEDGQAKYIDSYVQDITDRKRADDAAERIRAGFEQGSVAQALTSLEGKFIRVNEALAKLLGYPQNELEGMSFNDVTHPDDMNLGLDVMRNLLEGGEKARFEKRYVTSKGSVVWVDVNIAVVKDSRGNPQYFVGSFIDITSRKQAEEERLRFAEQLKMTLESTTTALSMAIEMRDPYTAGHQRRVADLACRIWNKLGLPGEACEGLRIAALLHDLGKLRIPTDILTKPTQLSQAEMALIREHALAGWDILRLVEFPWPVATIVRQHHERLDGTGYPDGLRGAEILREACVLAVADVVEAIASHRPYRATLGLDAAMEEITKGCGIFYSSDIVEACKVLFIDEGYVLPV